MMAYLPAAALAALALCALALPATGAERPKAEVACTATDQAHVYDCMIRLVGRRSGAPIEGARVVVGADMPSMPMTHNVRPVTAEPAGMPGHYRARIELEMHGEWALTLDVSGPLRDRLVEKLEFGPPAGQASHGGMRHGDMKPGGMTHGGAKTE